MKAFTASLAGLVLAVVTATIPDDAFGAPREERWSDAEKGVLASMLIERLPPAPADESNAFAARADAAALGKRLFADVRLSRDGRVACASCHAADRQFQDDRPLGQGQGTGRRRTMPIAAAAHSTWLFWDGRKDSLWAQALGPLEDGLEHGANRVQLVRLLATHYRRDYEAVFGRLPDLQGLPEQAGPLGDDAQRRAWQAMSGAQRDGINRAFANLGKAMAAYERTLRHGESRFDRYVRAVLAGTRDTAPALSREELAGLRLFLGKGQCATCHNGPLFSDQHFHNTGVPARDPARPDRGRAPAIAAVQADEFNCAGRYSDAPPQGCQELHFMALDTAAAEGAFKTPALRNVALRAPYMHAGQIATLEEVVEHYARSPAAAVGHSELAHGGAGHAERQPIRLSAQERLEVVAFLRALSGPIEERPAP
ncbi:cytochrome-c peroxidase [Piscinibacter sp.]|uniref:cytochrome-c peroxidase n=1 Tax=Piscinibacter sp. TaxID=1903157 RepID=UPI0035AE89CC